MLAAPAKTIPFFNDFIGKNNLMAAPQNGMRKNYRQTAPTCKAKLGCQGTHP